MNGCIKVVCLMMSVLVSLAGCNKEPESTNGSSPVATTTLLDEIAGLQGPGAAWNSQPIRNISQIEFNPLGKSVFYIAEEAGKYRAVHNGAAGTPYTNILTPVVSPDGRHLAYQAYVEDKLRMVVDGREGEVVEQLEIPFFSPDSRHIVYQAKTAGRWHFVVDGRSFPAHKVRHNQLGFSNDGNRLAYVDSVDDRSKPRLVVTDLDFKNKTVREATGATMVISAHRSRIAATSEAGGKQRVVELAFTKPDVVKEGALYDKIEQLAISADGTSVAYLAEKGGARVLVLNGQEKPFPAGVLVGEIAFRPGNKGVGFLTAAKQSCSLHHPFSGEAVQERQYDEVGELAYSRDGASYAYLGRKETPGKTGRSIFLVVNGKEGPKFDKITGPVFSPDGRRVVYRVRQDGKRFMVVSDLNGKILRQDPEYEMVFPPAFPGDGKLLAYGVKDGARLVWKVETL